MFQKNKNGRKSRKKNEIINKRLAIEHTCIGLIDVCRYLLSCVFNFVVFGEFITDYLENEFGKLKQSFRGTYFITVQNVIEKFHTEKNKLLLKC